jgi:hypothetical protein
LGAWWAEDFGTVEERMSDCGDAVIYENGEGTGSHVVAAKQGEVRSYLSSDPLAFNLNVNLGLEWGQYKPALCPITTTFSHHSPIPEPNNSGTFSTTNV